jgi:tRNA(His) 5'-end guanylyltransferase
MAILYNRQIFLTSKGSIGIGLAGVKLDDIVVVFHRAEVPFVLREDCISREVCSLLNEVYVYGIMDSELVNGESGARGFQIC